MAKQPRLDTECPSGGRWSGEKTSTECSWDSGGEVVQRLLHPAGVIPDGLTRN